MDLPAKWLLLAMCVYRAQKAMCLALPRESWLPCLDGAFHLDPLGREECPLCLVLGSQFPQLLEEWRVSTDSRLGCPPRLPVVSADLGNSESCFSLLPRHAHRPEVLLAAAGEPGDKEQEGPVCDDAEAAVPTVQLLGEGGRRAGNCSAP